MSEKPYELLARFKPDGSVGGVHVRSIVTVGGRDYETDPAPLSGATDPAFIAFAEQFAAATVSENEILKSQAVVMLQSIEQQEQELIDWQSKVSELQSRLSQTMEERDTAIQSHGSISATVIELQYELDAAKQKIAELETPKDPPPTE